jgi:MFS family permease
MLIARFFDGLAGSAFLSVAGGTVGDLFPKAQLSLPMAFYTAAPFVGPEIGPIVGGFINYYTNWRWTFYVLLIWSGVMLAAIIFLVPETYHPALLRDKAIKLRKDTGNPAWRAPIENMDKSVFRTVAWSCVRPFQLLFLEAMCLSLCILSAILLGILYLFFGVRKAMTQINSLEHFDCQCVPSAHEKHANCNLTSRRSLLSLNTTMALFYGRLGLHS